MARQLSNAPTRKAWVGPLVTLVSFVVLQLAGLELTDQATSSLSLFLGVLAEGGIPALLGLVSAWLVKPADRDQIARESNYG